ncbi:alpha/beta fold hydrolase [Pseudomonas sp. JAI120]|uniref:alpha/beta fold hydrolase n=1 Tax=Pseudomonas sp. JAI120 TaxID=2723063 RepID=UPI0030EB76B8
MKPSRSEFVEINGMRLHIRRWGDPEAPMLLMLHGWMDMSATFQFLVDALQDQWNIVAPDWSGFGQSQWNRSGYSMLQYVVELDALLDHFSPNDPINVVAHSMGANVSNIYFGARPQRLKHYVNIEGYAPVPGFFEGTLGDVVGRWLDQLRKPPQGHPYRDQDHLAQRLQQSNRNLPAERAQFLASQLGVIGADGLLRIAADPKARFVSPISLHTEQIMELWRDIKAPVLCVRGGRSFVSRAFESCPQDLQRRLAALPNGSEFVIPEGTHNLHHEVPEKLAELIETFLR